MVVYIIPRADDVVCFSSPAVACLIIGYMYIACGKYLTYTMFLLPRQHRWGKGMEFFRQIKTIP